jgi:putative SOS response-associated peptidase YedK
MREIHHRMGVVLDKAGCDAWLDPGTPPESLRLLMAPRSWPGVTKHRVSTFVNAVKNDNPTCIEPVNGSGKDQ